MTSTSHKIFGLAALLLAVLFPVYWIGAIGFSLDDTQMAWRKDFMSLDAWDLVFLIIGTLEIVVYIGLSRYFRHQINGRWASVLLMVMALLVAVFHSSLLIDVTIGLGMVEASTGVLDVMALAVLIVLFLYSLTLLTLSVVLLAQFPRLSALVKVFAVVAAVTAIIQLSVVFSVANLLLFPFLMLIVSFHFFLGENNIEVV